MTNLRGRLRERPYLPVGLVIGLVSDAFVLIFIPQWRTAIVDVLLVVMAVTVVRLALLRRARGRGL